MQATLALRDQMTAPLKHVQKALGDTTKQMASMQKQTKQSTSFMKQFTSSMVPEIAAGELLADTLKAIPGALADMVVWVVKATAEVLKLVSAENDWSTKTRAMFAVMDRGNGTGRTQLKIVTDLAKQQGISVESVSSTAQELLDSGVRNQRELQQSLKAVTDLQAAGADTAAGHLKSLIKRAASARQGGLFGGGGMDAWAGTAFFNKAELEHAGVSAKDFYDELSKIKGKPVSAWDLATYKIRASSKEMIKALSQAASKRVGPIAEKAWTLDRVKASWDATWKDMVSKVDFGPLYKALRGLIAIFDPLSKSGKTDSQLLTGAMTAIVKAVTWMVKTTTVWILKLEITFLKAFITIAPLVLRLAKWVKKHWDTIKSALIAVGIAMAALAAIFTIAAVLIGAAIFIMFLPLLLTLGAVLLGIFALVVAIRWLMKNFDSLKQKATDAAASMIDGLVTGITKGIVAVKGAIGQLSTTAIDTMKKALGIHSPSTAFAKLGKFAGLGFAAGFDGSMSGMKLSMPAGQIAGKSGVGEIHLGGINVQISGVKDAEQIAPQLIPALTDAIEQLLLEWGH